jgi:site-specific recombinase XerD
MPTIETATESFLQHRRLRGVSAGSLEIYTRWLHMWQAWRAQRELPPEVAAVTIDELRVFFDYLQHHHVPRRAKTNPAGRQYQGLAPATRDSIWRVLAMFWQYLADEDELTMKQTRFFHGGRIPRPQVPRQFRKACTQAIVDQLLAACVYASDEHNARNQAIILLLFESGMRVSELCQLRDNDIQIDRRQALVRAKGNRQRYVFWGEPAAAALRRYFRVRSGPVGGALIRGCSSRNPGGPMTRDGIRSLIKRLAQEVGVQLPANAPVHWFRHGFAHAALDAGLDVSQVQQLLGHTSIKTTQIYLQESPDRLRHIHARIWERQGTNNGAHLRGRAIVMTPLKSYDP